MTMPARGRGGDFLASVVDRAQDRAVSVAPRPASLFEPAQSRVAIGDAFDGDPPKTFVRDEAVDAAPHVQQPVHVESRERVARVPRVAERDDSATIVREVAPRMQRIPEAHVEPPSVAQLATTASVVESMRAPSPAAEPIAREPTPIGQPDRITTERASPHVDIAPRQPSLVANREAVAALTPQITEAREAGREPMQAAPTPPSVTISIGRLEVRATTPPTAALREANARKPARLDEYLGRRERAR